ncbi:alpha/beta hydrolase [Patescibacteria group bacterium]|nr:MAG: alpha/beta hydrolase [Patescibacteria group bacterium]
MERIAYIIPGFGHSPLRQRGYKAIGGFFERQGITPRYVLIDWHRKTPRTFTDFVRQFLKHHDGRKRQETYVLGFSYGATIAFLSATKIKPKALILCSLSPYFEEDMKNLKPSWIRWWRKHFKDSDYSFAAMAPRIRVKTYVVYGSKEHFSVAVRAKDARARIPRSSLRVSRGAEHKIHRREYLRTLERLIKTL